MNNKLVY